MSVRINRQCHSMEPQYARNGRLIWDNWQIHPSEVIDMRRNVMIYLVTAICICTASSAYAHHSHPLFYDQCKKLTIEGQVESVQWKNPHVLIVVKMDDGTTYTGEWTSMQVLSTMGIADPAQAALMAGARVVV